jgi:hypothetical protein
MDMLSMQPCIRNGTASDLEKCEKGHSLIFGEEADSENKVLTATPEARQRAVLCIWHTAMSVFAVGNDRLYCPYAST